ncbi:hypothetical protein [Microbacterium trichothecenolyticum]|uniref:TrbL/VirB6 plasmid conjugal transfer protein n=1 Tax=Microbacterium trichothecenolyticum TaxID=69370 RepID=A0A0M2H5S4_MICTR|nr:hypothetical protein [Microbacterium trichothecenolyticum]KJL41691.1 hypothetical protein RS82_02921 [Microbacterium trichothecenolyticum]
MNLRWVLRLGLATGLSLVLGSGTAAHAALVETAAPVSLATVTGEPWSAPAAPVDCQTASGQVTCTPTDPTKVTAQQCFMGVALAGQKATVCTTYEGHIPAIQADGGKALTVKYGCSLGDAVCLTFENAGRGMALTATGVMFLVADNMRFDTSTLLWSAAVDQWSFWQWAILIITFGAMVWAIAAAVVSGDRDELVGALVRTFIAIPAVPLTLWLTGHLLNAVDDMTWYILNGDGPASLYSTLQSVMWAGGQANYFFAFLIHGLLMLGMFLLMLVFAFRNIALAALIMVGPVAWMLFPVRRIGPQWVVGYLSAVMVLLLTAPLTIGFVTLIVQGLASVKTIWNPQSWPLLIGLVLVAFAPFAIFGLFSFTGAVAADSIGSRLGSHGGRMAANGARGVAAIPTRLGGLPSGVRLSGSGPSSSGPAAKPTQVRSGQANAPRGATAPAQGRTPAPDGGRTSTPSTQGSQTVRSPSSPQPQPPRPEGSPS